MQAAKALPQKTGWYEVIDPPVLPAPQLLHYSMKRLLHGTLFLIFYSQHVVARGKKLRLLIQELGSTEETYLAGLETLLNTYLTPMAAALASRLSPTSTLFVDTIAGLEAILAVNRVFLTELKSNIGTTRRSPANAFGEVMRRFASAWKLYRSYHSLYDQVLAQLDTIDNASVKALLVPVTGRPSVSNLLILPVQRLPRYELFLGEILKTEYNSHVEEALQVLRETVSWLDDRIATASIARTTSAPGTITKSAKKQPDPTAKRGSAPAIATSPSIPLSLSTSLTRPVTSPTISNNGSRIRTAAEREHRIAELESNLHKQIELHPSTQPDPPLPRRRSKSAEGLPSTSSTSLAPGSVIAAYREKYEQMRQENECLKALNQDLLQQLEKAELKIEKLEEYKREHKGEKKKKDKQSRKALAMTLSSVSFAPAAPLTAQRVRKASK